MTQPAGGVHQGEPGKEGLGKPQQIRSTKARLKWKELKAGAKWEVEARTHGAWGRKEKGSKR